MEKGAFGTLTKCVATAAIALLWTAGVGGARRANSATPAAHGWPKLSGQSRGSIRGGGGSSTSRVVSPAVVASWMSHDNYANGASTTLLVLWRGTPGWFAKGGPRGGSGGGGGGATGWQTISEGGLTFDLAFDYDRSTVKILKEDLSLEETNVVLVDFVDSASGPQIVGRRWVEPAPPQQPPVPDPIAAIIKRTPDLFEYLRCDATLPGGYMSAVMSILCGQMRP